MEPIEQSQLKYRVADQFKKTLSLVLILLSLTLAFLPFWTSFQDLLTRGIMSIGWYRAIQDVIVPYELKVAGHLLLFIGLPIQVGNSYIQWITGPASKEVVYLAWNCVGWQSFILFAITLITGLAGQHKLESKLEALILGILGTYLLNLFRIMIVVVVYFFVGRPFGVIFHDYFSNLLTLSWLFFYWWFSYNFVLQSSESLNQGGEA